MKRTISIHIGGYVFNIEEDAYSILETWLNSLQSKFSNDNDGSEILQDIEQGVAEHFKSMLDEAKSAITISNVNEVIRVMGAADQIKDEAIPENQEHDFVQNEEESKSNKRFFRDNEDRYIGGVASGIAHFLGVKPVWIRLAFILTSLFFAGSGIVIYLILLLTTPYARSRAEKLSMRGERMNIDNIQESVKQEFEQIKARFGDFKNSDEYSLFKQKAQNISANVSDSLARILNIFSGIIGVAIVLTTFIVLSVLSLFFFTDNRIFMPDGMVYFSDIQQLIPFSTSPFLFKLGIVLIVGIPVVGILLAGFRLIFKFKTNHKIFGISGTLLWLAGLAFIIVSGLGIAKNLEYEQNTLTNESILLRDSTIYLSLNDLGIELNSPNTKNMDNFVIKKTDDKFAIFGKPNLYVRMSSDSISHIRIERYARGNSPESAFNNIKSIVYNNKLSGDSIWIDNYFRLPDNSAYSGQMISVYIDIPNNFSIYLDKQIAHFDGFIRFKNSDWHGNNPGRFWRMTPDGLELSE